MKAFEAGLNLVPPALCVLEVGVLLLGVRPRSTSAVCAAGARSLLVEDLGGAAGLHRGCLAVSVLRQAATTPPSGVGSSSAAGT
ncbi:MAG: hypothetical protein ABSF27_02750 [Candidatus Dormibacteria bacterium]|jgi:hypothetical protein